MANRKENRKEMEKLLKLRSVRLLVVLRSWNIKSKENFVGRTGADGKRFILYRRNYEQDRCWKMADRGRT